MMMLNMLFFYRLTYEQLEHSFGRLATERDVITSTSWVDDDDEFGQVSDI